MKKIIFIGFFLTIISLTACATNNKTIVKMDNDTMENKNQNELFYFRFIGFPLPNNPESKKVGGAYINCWVNENDYDKAEKKAIASIEAENWRIDKLDDWMVCNEKNYLERKDLEKEELNEILNSIKEAFKYGISKTFHCWDKDAPDANKEYE